MVWTCAPDQEVDQRGHAEVVQKNCQWRNLNREDAMDRGRWKKLIKTEWWWGWWVSVSSGTGSPGRSGQRAVKRLLLFVSWLRCINVVHRRPTKLCTMFGHLLGWYTMYTLVGALALQGNFDRCKIHFASKSCILIYWQRYTAWHSSSGHLPNFAAFSRGRHLY